jgi:hypothetical protein
MAFSGKNFSNKEVTYKAGRQKPCQFVEFSQYFSNFSKKFILQPATIKFTLKQRNISDENQSNQSQPLA